MRSLRGNKFVVVTLLAAMLASGCQQGAKNLHYLGDADLDYYRNTATDISYAGITTPIADQVEQTFAPRTLESRQEDEVWELTLQEAMHTALVNSEVIKSAGQFLTPGNQVFTNNSPTIYDPAIQETNVLFGAGGRGLQAALADFDTNWAVNTFFNKDENVQNNAFNGAFGNTLVSETAAFNTTLSKNFAYGASFSVTHDWDFLRTNTDPNAVLFNSTFNGGVAAEYRQQLLAGAGAEFVRTAGPLGAGNLAAVTGVGQGILIARINNDVTLAQFEASVRNLLLDVENSYWDLYFAYRVFDIAVRTRNAALDTWRDLKTFKDAGGGPGFQTWAEAQARDRYFETRAQAENALTQLYTTEQNFRNLLHLAVNDGKIIRPKDEPIRAKVEPDWHLSVAEAITERVELRQQLWRIKSLQFQLRAAENLVQPRLDLVAGYRVNAFGNRLLGDDGGASGFESAYDSLVHGDQDGWTLGFEYNLPIGLRNARTQVRNLELQLARAQKILAAQELEISHELAVAFQTLSQSYATSISNFYRMNAARERSELLNELKEGGGTQSVPSASLTDLLLRAQESAGFAERDFYQSIVDYNKALANLQYRKGTLLQYNSVELLEGGWMPEAYQQALERAWARSHGLPAKHLRKSTEDYASSVPVRGMAPSTHEVIQAIEQTPTMLEPAEETARPMDTTPAEADDEALDQQDAKPPQPAVPQPTVSQPTVPQPTVPQPTIEDSKSANREDLYFPVPTTGLNSSSEAEQVNASGINQADYATRFTSKLWDEPPGMTVPESMVKKPAPAKPLVVMPPPVDESGISTVSFTGPENSTETTIRPKNRPVPNQQPRPDLSSKSMGSMSRAAGAIIRPEKSDKQND